MVDALELADLKYGDLVRYTSKDTGIQVYLLVSEVKEGKVRGEHD